jgi:alpha-L-fucosidase 2
MTNNDNGVFEYLGVHLTALNESLLQSYNDRIRVFPAVPSDSSFVGKFTLLAKDGLLVSSEREAGEIKYVGLKSLYGNPARVVNPWGTAQIRVRRTSDNAILATSTAAEISFATAANTVYVIERTAKPLSAYAPTRLTGTANQNVKTLSGTASTLGLGAAPAGTGISLRAHANGLYVSAANAGAAPLIANRTAIGPWETFDRIDLGNGNIALRSRANGLLVCADNAGAAPLIANRTAVGQWETFQLIRNPDGTVSLRAQANGNYVTAENGGAAALIANRTAVGPWETFDLITS